MNLFINRNFDATSSLVTSSADLTTKSIQSLYLGDVQEINITLVDGTGYLDEKNGEASLKVAIGDLDLGTILAETNAFDF